MLTIMGNVYTYVEKCIKYTRSRIKLTEKELITKSINTRSMQGLSIINDFVL